jgi:hypothetical protein
MTAKLIYEVLPKIIGEVAPIAKARKNQQQGYSFRGVDDVYSALNLLLAKYGVCIIPEVIEREHEAFDSKSGGKLFRTRLLVRFHLTASDESELCAVVPGEGMDSGDKSMPKALSVAYKYMAFQVFCIPANEKIDVEEDSPDVKHGNGNGVPKLSAEDKARIQKETCAEFLTQIDGAKDMPTLRTIGAAIADARAKELLTVEQTEKELNLAYVKRQKALQTQPKEAKA